jgi:hypothetical protein
VTGGSKACPLSAKILIDCERGGQGSYAVRRVLDDLGAFAQEERERRAFAQVAVEHNSRAKPLGQRRGDGKSEADASVRPGLVAETLHERLEDLLVELGGDAPAVVADPDLEALLAAVLPLLRDNHDDAAGRVLHRVVHEDAENLFHLVARVRELEVLGDREDELRPFFLGARLQICESLLQVVRDEMGLRGAHLLEAFPVEPREAQN